MKILRHDGSNRANSALFPEFRGKPSQPRRTVRIFKASHQKAGIGHSFGKQSNPPIVDPHTMTTETTKTPRIRAAQTQIGNKSLQPADQPPLLTRLSDVPNLLRRQTETGHIYKYKGAVFARSRQTSGFPSGAKCRSRKVGRRRPRPTQPRDRRNRGARRNRGTGGTAGQKRPQCPAPLSKNLRRAPYPRIGGSRTAEFHPPKPQKRSLQPKKAAVDLVFQNFLVYLYPDKLFRR